MGGLPTSRLAVWIAAGGALLAITADFLPILPPILRTLGEVMFLWGALGVILETRERHSKMDARLQDISCHLSSVDDRLAEIGRTSKAAMDYGTAISVIAETLVQVEGKREHTPHIRAGGLALQEYALSVIPNRARQLRDLLHQRQFMTLVEHHYLNEFLKKLVEALPDGSSWFGITHVTQGWLKDKSEPGYRAFVDAMQRRSRAQELTALRIYCFHTDAERAELNDHLSQEHDAGIVVKCSVLGRQSPPDLSLIWPVEPSLRSSLAAAHPEPVGLFTDRHFEPVCGLDFATQQGRLIKELSVYVPPAQQLVSLQQQFANAWRAADSYLG